MTKKDYELIADAIAHTGDKFGPFAEQAHDTLVYIAHCLANGLAQGNPRFDRARFLLACGVNQ